MDGSRELVAATRVPLVDHATTALHNCGYNVMFVSLECTNWGGPSRWNFTVQIYGTGRLVKITNPDQRECERLAREWLRAVLKQEAA